MECHVPRFFLMLNSRRANREGWESFAPFSHDPPKVSQPVTPGKLAKLTNFLMGDG